jgi:hypothetical protein
MMKMKIKSNNNNNNNNNNNKGGSAEVASETSALDTVNTVCRTACPSPE